jgi:molybdenum cofactor cytidylyltransferase
MMPPPSPCGAILLAAGRGRRFDPTGQSNKLLQTLPGGDAVVVASARALLALAAQVVAVVRPGDDAVADALRSAGCEVTVCPDADAGMGASLAHGARHVLASGARHAGWLVALGDMPTIAPSSLRAVGDALAAGAPVAAPVHAGRRGHPVGFAAHLLPQLAQLRGDEGGRAVIAAAGLTPVAVNDPGVLRDIDFPADLNPLTISQE